MAQDPCLQSNHITGQSVCTASLIGTILLPNIEKLKHLSKFTFADMYISIHTNAWLGPLISQFY